MLRGVFGIEVNQFNALSAGIILGLLVLPTIASVAEDALTAVPASLREGAFGLGASKLQVSLRVVFPAALSGVVAALILGASRAVGETVIILVAGGQVARLGARPDRRLPVDGRLHRRHRARRHPDGLDQVRDDLRRRHGAVRHDAGAQRALDPAREPLPPGVRVTGAQMALKARTQTSVFPSPSTRSRVASLVFRAFMYAAIAVGFIGLGAILFDVARDGLPRLSWDFLTRFPSRIIPERSGIQSALVGTLYLMAICAVLVVPLGVATAIYLEEYADRKKWFNRLIEVNIQNLAAVPVGRVRHPRPRLHRARPAVDGPGAPGGRDHALAAGAARS